MHPDSSRADEKELWQKAKGGDLSAFEMIVLSYEKAIFAHIRRITGQTQDAEDLTQETFLKLYRALDSLSPEKNCRAFLYTIATNTAYDWLRAKRTRQELFIIDDQNRLFETIDERSSYNHAELVHDMERALERLKPAYKAVLVLFYSKGLGYGEIGNSLALPLNTVKTLLYRAKKALARELRPTYGAQ